MIMYIFSNSYRELSLLDYNVGDSTREIISCFLGESSLFARVGNRIPPIFSCIIKVTQ